MNPIARTAVQLLFPVLVLVGSGPVWDVTSAADPTPDMSVRLKLTKHALDTPRGVALTYARIQNAARSVCGDPDRIFYQERAHWEECVAATVRSTVVKVGDARLTEFDLAKLHRPRGSSLEDSRVGLRTP